MITDEFIQNTLMTLHDSYPGKVKILQYPNCHTTEGDITLELNDTATVRIILSYSGGLWSLRLTAALGTPLENWRKVGEFFAGLDFLPQGFSLESNSDCALTLHHRCPDNDPGESLTTALPAFLAETERLIGRTR